MIRSSHRQGALLVAVQLALIAALAWLAGPAFARGSAPAGAWAIGMAGVLLGLWAVSCNRPGNFNVHPAPREGGQLVQHGPYRWIRHPMYTAVMACGLSCALAGASPWGWLGAAALVAVLTIKAMLEERLMMAAHSDYGAYCGRTWRFLPGVF